MKSLQRAHSPLASPEYQVAMLEDQQTLPGVTKFSDKLRTFGLAPLRTTGIDIFQVNVGKMCNQTCKHCHVDAGPDRKEIMTRETMQLCLDILSRTDIATIDITGGAPEMNPHFRWFVKELSKLGKKVMVRCNLTILIANPKYRDLPQFYARHGVEIVSSLPFYNPDRTDRQRGEGVFAGSIEALQLLNAVGYGVENSGLLLDLVYNPSGAFLPATQQTLEPQFRKVLQEQYGISFNHLFAITNMPISRFLEFLLNSGNYIGYMEKLINAFNPQAVPGVMCRNTISVSWDGYLYDCDFNQMLDLKVETHQHLKDFDLAALNQRNIVTGQHCYGCTAGAGSSCGGNTV